MAMLQQLPQDSAAGWCIHEQDQDSPPFACPGGGVVSPACWCIALPISGSTPSNIVGVFVSIPSNEGFQPMEDPSQTQWPSTVGPLPHLTEEASLPQASTSTSSRGAWQTQATCELDNPCNSGTRKEAVAAAVPLKPPGTWTVEGRCALSKNLKQLPSSASAPLRPPGCWCDRVTEMSTEKDHQPAQAPNMPVHQPMNPQCTIDENTRTRSLRLRPRMQSRTKSVGSTCSDGLSQVEDDSSSDSSSDDDSSSESEADESSTVASAIQSQLAQNIQKAIQIRRKNEAHSTPKPVLNQSFRGSAKQ